MTNRNTQNLVNIASESLLHTLDVVDQYERAAEKAQGRNDTQVKEYAERQAKGWRELAEKESQSLETYMEWAEEDD